MSVKLCWCCLVFICLCGLAVADEVATVSLAPRWTADQFVGAKAIEREVIRLTNEERRMENLSQLSPSIELQTAARQHSREMGEKKYFAHESPVATWRLPWQRTYCAGYWGCQVGENIVEFTLDGVASPEALAARCVKMWLDSPKHRENMLEPKWSIIGIGAVQVGDMLYCTQLFAAPLVTLEGATVTPVSGELVTLKIDGTLNTGVATLWANELLADTMLPKLGNFSTTISYPRKSGKYNLMVGVGNEAIWMATLDTDRTGKDALEVTRVIRDDVVTNTAIAVTPFTGLRLTGTIISPDGQKVGFFRDGTLTSYLATDKNRRATFDMILPKRDKIYTLGFIINRKPEDMLFIDTNEPLKDAFHCRPN